MKTSKLTGPALDWAVEKALGTFWSANGYFVFKNPERFDAAPEWAYSTDWAHGGPIIAGHCMSLKFDEADDFGEPWRSACLGHDASGPTLLIAAMRSYVASKLGDEVDVPAELLA